MKMDQTEKLILEAIDQHRDEIIEFARDIYDHGELGYKEFNITSNSEEAKELIKKNTRNYAKRQLTFFKHQFKDVIWFNSYIEAYSYLKEHKDEFR